MAQHKQLKDAIREKTNRERLMKLMQEQMKISYQRGLLYGSRAVLGAVTDKIAEPGTAEEKLNAITKMVNTMLSSTDKTAEEDRKRVANASENKAKTENEVLSGIIDKATEITDEDDDE